MERGENGFYKFTSISCIVYGEINSLFEKIEIRRILDEKYCVYDILWIRIGFHVFNTVTGEKKDGRIYKSNKSKT